MNLLEAGPGVLMRALMVMVVVVVMMVSQAKSPHPARSPMNPYVHVTVLKSSFRRAHHRSDCIHSRLITLPTPASTTTTTITIKALIKAPGPASSKFTQGYDCSFWSPRRASLRRDSNRSNCNHSPPRPPTASRRAP